MLVHQEQFQKRHMGEESRPGSCLDHGGCFCQRALFPEGFHDLLRWGTTCLQAFWGVSMLSLSRGL